MKRKLVKQGAATMMISLPAKWVKQHKLSKGAEIDIEQVEDNLCISADQADSKSETEITLKNLTESSIRTLITNTYRAGCDKIKVNYESQQQYKILQSVIKTRLIGFDVIKKEKNYCVVENITEPSIDQFDSIVHKIFFSISDFFDVTKRRMQGEDLDFEEISERIQKYDNFCRRVIAKRRGHKSELVWTFLTLILHGQRELHYLNKALNKKSDKQTIDYLDQAQQLFELIKQAYLQKDIHLLAKVHKQEKELIYTQGYALLSKNPAIIYHIMSAIRKFYQANSPLSGLIL